MRRRYPIDPKLSLSSNSVGRTSGLYLGKQYGATGQTLPFRSPTSQPYRQQAFAGYSPREADRRLALGRVTTILYASSGADLRYRGPRDLLRTHTSTQRVLRLHHARHGLDRGRGGWTRAPRLSLWLIQSSRRDLRAVAGVFFAAFPILFSDLEAPVLVGGFPPEASLAPPHAHAPRFAAPKRRHFFVHSIVKEHPTAV